MSEISNLELTNIFAKLSLVQNEQSDNNEYSAPNLKETIETSPVLINPTPNNPPWNSLMAIGVWMASVLFIFIFPAFFIVPYIAFNKETSLENMANDPTAIILNVLGIFPAHIFTLILAWFVVTKNRQFSFKEVLGWSNKNFKWFYHILIIIGFFAVAGVVNYFVPEQENEFLKLLRSSRTVVFIVAFLATFTAPLVEEVVYRGILYSAIQRSIGVKWAILIVTALFAIVHVPQYWGSPGTIFLICFLSLILTLIRVRTNNLLPCIILHTIFNGIQSAVLIAEPYLLKPETQLPEQAATIFNLIT